MLCEVCEVKEAVSRCRMCGRYVCEDHLGPDGLCSICREVLCEVCHQKLSVNKCLICGKLVCRSCSVELQPAIRVCRECYSKLLSDESYSKFREYLRRFIKGKSLIINHE